MGLLRRSATRCSLSVAAVLAGSRSVYAIGQWIAGCSQKTLRVFGARVDPVTGWYVGPDEKTVRGLCARLDGDALDAVVGRWLQRRALAAARAKARTGVRPPAGRRARRRAKAAGQRRRASTRDRHRPRLPQVAVDGKTSRGAKTAGNSAPHLLAALSCAGVVLAQRQIADKSNEIGAFVGLLTPLDLVDHVVTADAMQTQRKNARWLREEKKAHFVFPVLDNQPTLFDRLDALDWAGVPVTAWSVDDDRRSPGRRGQELLGETQRFDLRRGSAPMSGRSAGRATQRLPFAFGRTARRRRAATSGGTSARAGTWCARASRRPSSTPHSRQHGGRRGLRRSHRWFDAGGERHADRRLAGEERGAGLRAGGAAVKDSFAVARTSLKDLAPKAVSKFVAGRAGGTLCHLLREASTDDQGSRVGSRGSPVQGAGRL